MRNVMAARLAVLALGLLAPGAARAIPCASCSTIPGHVVMVGRLGPLADTALGSFTVVVRDLANNPVAGSRVEFRLLNCSGARVSSQSYQPGVGVACATHGVTAVADVQGVARFAIVGGGTADAPPGGGACAAVYASGVLLGNVAVAYADLDGTGGVDIRDLTLWLQDLARAEPISRSDFDADGTVGINDLAVWLGWFGGAGSFESAAAYCP